MKKYNNRMMQSDDTDVYMEMLQTLYKMSGYNLKKLKDDLETLEANRLFNEFKETNELNVSDLELK